MIVGQGIGCLLRDEFPVIYANSVQNGLRLKKVGE